MFNCSLKCLYKDDTMIWRWNEKLLYMPRGMETEQWACMYDVTAAKIHHAGLTAMPYFLAKQ